MKQRFSKMDIKVANPRFSLKEQILRKNDKNALLLCFIM